MTTPVYSRVEAPEGSDVEAPDKWVSLAESKNATGVPSFENYYDKVKKTFKPITRAKKLVRKETAKPECDNNRYDFTYAKRGLAVIINNEEFDPKTKFPNRNGSTKDAENLQKMFNSLGFDVMLHNNQTGDQMVHLLQKVASNNDYDHTTADCFACAILSHGDNEKFPPTNPPYDAMLQHDLVYGVDGTIVPTSFLLGIFNDECCPELEGKPRLFFIQACRGRDLDDGKDVTVLKPRVALKTLGAGKDTLDASPEEQLEKLNLDEGKSEEGEGPVHSKQDESGQTVPQYVYTISPSPIYKDFLLMYATPPGYFAWRNKTDGAWMIQHLTPVLQQEGIADVSLMSLLARVSWGVSRMQSVAKGYMNRKKAVPCVMSMLTKDVYFTSKTPPR